MSSLAERFHDLHRAGTFVTLGVTAADDIARVVAIGAPVNVLALPGAPAVAELAALGVRRVSSGGALARVAYKAAEVAARELFDHGTYGYLARL